MEETFERIAEHLYKRQYQSAVGWKTIYYARFVCRLKGKRRTVSLGNDLTTAREELKILEARNIRREDFDLDREVKPEGMTVARWSQCYLELEQVKKKRSLSRDRDMIASVNRHMGSILLTEIKREHLFKYRNDRLQEHIIRAGKPAAKTVSAGTMANELSCLRTMLNRARECEIEAATPSFKGLIYRTQRDRILDADEETALLDAYPPWLKRLSIVAKETCLSEDSLKRCVSRKTLSNWRRALEGKKHVSLTRHKHVTPTHVEEVVRFTDDENDRKKWASPGCRQKVAREQVTDTQKSVAKVADFVEARPGQKRPVATLPLIRRFGAFRRRNHCRLTGAW